MQKVHISIDEILSTHPEKKGPYSARQQDITGRMGADIEIRIKTMLKKQWYQLQGELNVVLDKVLGQTNRDPNTFMQLLASYGAASKVEPISPAPSLFDRLFVDSRFYK